MLIELHEVFIMIYIMFDFYFKFRVFNNLN